MKRTIKKQFWFNREEARDLQRKAKKTCLTEAALIRVLLRGYEPKEKPDERFYDAMRALSEIGNEIQIIESRMHDGVEQKEIQRKLEIAVAKLRVFQDRIEKEYLEPKESDIKWQS